MTPYSQTYETQPGDRKALINHFTTMRLVHLAKDGTEKDSFPLKLVHEELEKASLTIQGSGASNILVYKVSFGCKITLRSGKEVRKYYSFNLKIPGTNTGAEAVLSYEMLERAYGSKANLYEAIEHLYERGRKIANPDDDKHGNVPLYASADPSQGQYIRHTEQLLAAQLMLPEAAQILAEQLRGTIRANHADAIAVKVYNMGLHLHSTKTCCSPCEYTLLGLMYDYNWFVQNGKRLGFLPNFATAAVAPNETLTMKLPDYSLFRLLVTVTATQPHTDHQKQPRYTRVSLQKKGTPFYDISVKSQKSSETIFTTMVNPGYDLRRVPDISSLSEMTVGISGSKENRGSKKTIAKVRELREEDVSKERHVTEHIAFDPL
jgi:hypothetical protein